MVLFPEIFCNNFFIIHPPAYLNVYQNIYSKLKKWQDKKQKKLKKKREYLEILMR